MYQVLDIGLSGMNSIEFSNGQQNTRWVLETDLEEILLPKNGKIIGFDDQNLHLVAERNQNVGFVIFFWKGTFSNFLILGHSICSDVVDQNFLKMRI